MRPVLRLLAPLLGLAVAAVGLGLAAETVTAWLAPASSPLVVPWPQWRTALLGLTWNDGAVRAVAIGVGIVGLVLLVVGLGARRRDVHLTDPVPEVTVTTSPHSLARAVGQEVRRHADVAQASVVASPRRVVVRAATHGDVSEVDQGVRARVDEVLDRLPLRRRPTVRVSVSGVRGVR